MTKEEDNIISASPKARKFARELGADLKLIKGTKRQGRVTEDDIKILKGRLSSDKFEIPEAEHVAYTNLEVTSHNEKMMSMDRWGMTSHG